jgi:MFS superfamily sulfate permease-like transporter
MNPLKNYNLGLFRAIIGGYASLVVIPVGAPCSNCRHASSQILYHILALVAYFILGSSSQVIIGPDFATPLFAATVAHGEDHGSASRFSTDHGVGGVLMFAAGALKLGFMPTFSRCRSGVYLNGVSTCLSTVNLTL